MQLRGFSPRTHEAYLSSVESLAAYHHRSPDQLDVADIQAYLKYVVVDKKLSPSTCRVRLNGIRFLFVEVLERAFDVGDIAIPKRPQRIPELLNRAEVRSILEAPENLKHRTLLMTCYSCGLRLSELIHIRVRDIDGERRLLRVEQGKGAKDRLVPMPPSLLKQLRFYWQRVHPDPWLFPGQNPQRCLNPCTAQRVYQQAKGKAGIRKRGGIHALRHAYATHSLEADLSVHQLQRRLGHRDIHSTLHYVHWTTDTDRQ